LTAHIDARRTRRRRCNFGRMLVFGNPPAWRPVAPAGTSSLLPPSADGSTSRNRLGVPSRFILLTAGQGFTLVHFSAQLEPCLTHKNTLHTLNTPLTRATQPFRAPPIPYKALKLSLTENECMPLPPAGRRSCRRRTRPASWAAGRPAPRQGLTLVHISAQRERFVRDRGCS
jgi:hypothetical protein